MKMQYNPLEPLIKQDEDMQLIQINYNQSKHFDLITYPDGQHSIGLKLELFDVKQPIKLHCSIKNFAEFEVLLCFLSALRKNDFYVQHINFVYLFGMRCDRAFHIGEPNYSRDVLGFMLNNMKTTYNIEAITILWPFAPMPISCGHFIHNIYGNGQIYMGDHKLGLTIGGDGSVTEFQGKKTDCNFIKKRDNGLLTVDMTKGHQEILGKAKFATIVDDLCDGGATFIQEAKFIKRLYPELKLNLFVYHGLFSNNALDKLGEYFDKINSLNSCSDIIHPKLNQIKVI